MNTEKPSNDTLKINTRMQITEEEKKYIQKQTYNDAVKYNKNNKNYIITIAPPNATGSLHLGHALVFTFDDIIARYRKLQGYNIIMRMGFDHAGIATQMQINKKYGHLIDSIESARRYGMELVNENINSISSQLKELNLLVDWNNLHFTMDEKLSQAVTKAFVELYNAGLIYCGTKIVNWDTKLKTAISDIEVCYKEEIQDMVYIEYKGSGFSMQVATTRPETIFADVALAVNPTDVRYANLIGKEVKVPIINRVIPIISSTKVDALVGTGVLKITPAHSFLDYEIGKKNNLPAFNIIDEEGLLSGEHVPEEFRGMSTSAARDIIKNRISIRNVPVTSKRPYGDRSNSLIEPRITRQWFFDCKGLAQDSTSYVKTGQTNISPSVWLNDYNKWNENIQEWCISRGIWWGHQIPVWRDESGKEYCSENEEEAKKLAKQIYGHEVPLTREPGVLDTWFSSSIFHLTCLGWPNDFDEGNAPADVVVTGYDILGFWINRMMIMSHFFLKKPAFKNIVFTRLVRDAQGRKMSKTIGNGLDPIDMSNKYSVDALRCSLVFESKIYHDLKISEHSISNMSKFITKIWNTARYITQFLDKVNKDNINVGNDHFSHYLGGDILELEQKYNEQMELLNINESFNLVYHYIWNKFCKYFLEIHKIHSAPEYFNVLYWAFGKILILLHPFAPYITEKLWKTLKYSEENSIISTSYLSRINFNSKIAEKINIILSLIPKIKKIKEILNITDQKFILNTDDIEIKDLIIKNKETFSKLLRVDFSDSFLYPITIFVDENSNWKIQSPLLNKQYLKDRYIQLRDLQMTTRANERKYQYKENDKNIEITKDLEVNLNVIDNIINKNKFSLE